MTMQLDPIAERVEIKQHARVVAKAWLDPSFKESLLADPNSVLADFGFDVRAGSEVRFVDDADITMEEVGDVVYFGLPSAPSTGLGDEHLGGVWYDVRGCGGPCNGHTAHTTNTTASGPANCTGPFCAPG